MPENLQPNPDPAPSQPHKDQGLGTLTWALSSLAFLLMTPLVGITVALVMWLLKKDDSEYMDRAGRAALNFQISYTIWLTLSTILIVSIILLPIGIPALIVFGVMWLIFAVLGSIRAADGQPDYKPFATIQFL